MPRREAVKREPSTGNVFADLGLPDAGEHLIKAGLARKGQTTNCDGLPHSAAEPQPKPASFLRPLAGATSTHPPSPRLAPWATLSRPSG